MVDMRLKDAPIRFRCEVAEVCDRAVNPADPAIAKISGALVKLLTSNQVDVLILPLGIGHHVDHATVREAALPFAKEMACGFYEDLPYASRAGAEAESEQLRAEVAERMSGTLSSLVLFDGEAAVETKREMARIYSSQIDESTVEDIARFAERYGGERIWADARLVERVRGDLPGWTNAVPTSAVLL